jgi:hypothetical protein
MEIRPRLKIVCNYENSWVSKFGTNPNPSNNRMFLLVYQIYRLIIKDEPQMRKRAAEAAQKSLDNGAVK